MKFYLPYDRTKPPVELPDGKRRRTAGVGGIVITIGPAIFANLHRELTVDVCPAFVLVTLVMARLMPANIVSGFQLRAMVPLVTNAGPRIDVVVAGAACGPSGLAEKSRGLRGTGGWLWQTSQRRISAGSTTAQTCDGFRVDPSARKVSQQSWKEKLGGDFRPVSAWIGSEQIIPKPARSVATAPTTAGCFAYSRLMSSSSQFLTRLTGSRLCHVLISS